MRAFPIFMRLQGQRVLVVGAGQAAAAKQRLLQSAGAQVERTSDRLPTRDLTSYSLVFVATGDEERDRAIAAAGREARVPVNVVDRPELSDFIMPAVVDRGDVVIGISTGGGSPILAQRVRAWIEDALPERLDRLAAFARHFRAAVQNRIPDNNARRRFWDRFFDGEGAALVMQGNDARAARRMIRDLNSENSARGGPGSLTVIDLASNDADDLTLRTLRLLRKADVIAHGSDLAPEILDCARRDAARVTLDDDLSAHAGRRVVVLRLAAADKRTAGGAR